MRLMVDKRRFDKIFAIDAEDFLVSIDFVEK